MFISADQLLCHAIGDYILQSHWMATEKTKQSIAAAVHAACYGVPFLFLKPSISALVLIVGTHFLIDRYRLARFVVFSKNFLAPKEKADLICHIGFESHIEIKQVWPVWADAQATGYPSDAPPWLSVWLLIIADNILHIVLNGLALKYL